MTNRTSLYSNLGYDSLLVPAVRNADTNSTSVDLQDCDDASIQFHIGASADTLSGTNKIELEVQESDDNSTFTAVANADLTNYATATNTGTVFVVISNGTASTLYKAGYRGSKRYIRGVLNFSGTHTTGTVTAVTALRGRNRNQPINALT
jgi:hypothetical protein